MPSPERSPAPPSHPRRTAEVPQRASGDPRRSRADPRAAGRGSVRWVGARLHALASRLREHPWARHLRWVVPPALVALMLAAFGAADVGARLAGADPLWISVSVVCLLAQTLLMTLRWRLVARALGLRFGKGWALREYFLAQLVNMTLPGGVLGDAARAVRSQAGPAGLRTATQAVILERAIGQAGVMAVAAGGLAWAVARGLDLPPSLLHGLALAGLVAGLLAALGALTWRGRRVASLVARAVPTLRARLAQTALAIGAALLNVAAFAASARATGTVLGIPEALALVPLVLTAMLVPFSVAGWGWREGAAAALFPLAGASAAAGVAAGIVYGIAMLIAALPALPLMLRSGGPGAVAAAEPGDAPGAGPAPRAVRTREAP